MAEELNKSLREGKMQQLFNFLDQVEDETEKELTASKCSSVCSFSIHSFNDDFKEGSIIVDSPTNESLQTAEQGSHMLGSLKEKMMNMNVQIEDQSRTIEVLQNALEQNKKRMVQMETENATEMKRKLTQMRKEHDISSTRHLNFVDRLLSDKDQLSQECAALGGRMHELELQSRKKLEILKEEHIRILKNEKEKWDVVEKRKRNNWISKKTKEIKEQTIKSLEPEIQLLMENHKKDMEKRQESHSDEIYDLKVKLRLEKEETISCLKETLAKQREDIFERERKSFEEKLTNKCEEYAYNLTEQNKRLQKEWELERTRILDKHRATRTRWQDSMEILKTRHKEYIRTLETKFTNDKSNIQEKHLIEIKRCEEKFYREQELFKKDAREKFATQMQEKERLMRESIMADKKEELEMLVEKVVQDATDQEMKLERKHKLLIDDLKKRYDERLEKRSEKIKELESSNKKFSKKNQDLKLQNQKISLTNRALEKEIFSLKKNMKELNEKIKLLTENMEESKNDYQIEKLEDTKHLRHQIETLEQTINEQTREKERCKFDFENEIEKLDEKKNLELGQLETRVRQALCRKDEILFQLRQQIEGKDLRIAQTEKLLDQQKHDFVKSFMQDSNCVTSTENKKEA